MSESAEQRFIGAAQQDITIIHIFCKTRLLSLNQRIVFDLCKLRPKKFYTWFSYTWFCFWYFDFWLVPKLLACDSCLYVSVIISLIFPFVFSERLILKYNILEFCIKTSLQSEKGGDFKTWPHLWACGHQIHFHQQQWSYSVNLFTSLVAGVHSVQTASLIVFTSAVN